MMGFGGLGMIFMLVSWIVIIGLAVWVLSNLFPRATDAFRRGRDEEADSSLEILKQRYARGEISRDEYEEMREVLRAETR